MTEPKSFCKHLLQSLKLLYNAHNLNETSFHITAIIWKVFTLNKLEFFVLIFRLITGN